MTEERQTLMMIKGIITTLTSKQQADVAKHAQTLRTMMQEGGGEFMMAFSLVGAETAVED